MKLLYIGEYIPGCTSRFRAEQLCELLRPLVYQAVDTHVPVQGTTRIFRSLGWRYKKGPLIRNINQYILQQLTAGAAYDLVWVDKADFITPETTRSLRQIAGKLVHYTPDNSFYSNRSPYFDRAAAIYDYCITTKSFETELYRQKGVRNVLFCTQGYNPAVHHPYTDNTEKAGVVFAGLYEPSRGEILGALVEAGIPVKLAGKGWGAFLKKYGAAPGLEFKGELIMGEAYGRLISGALVGLGLLSKRFPEQHTTRTFEIPACKTLLATEKTPEIASWFAADEVCYFSDTSDLVQQLKVLLAEPGRIREMAEKGYHTVVQKGYDNASVLKGLLTKMEVL